MSSHSYHRLYFHFVWSVKDREAVLVGLNRDFVAEVIHEAACERGTDPLALYVMPAHVHLFVRLAPTMTPATFIGQIKGVVARAFNAKFGNRFYLKWQDGYGVVTVREGEREKVISYVENQLAIHANRQASRTLESIEEVKETLENDK